MPEWTGFGRILIAAGALMILAGAAFSLLQNLPAGRLPGDLVWRRGNFTLFIPLATSLIISLLLTLILNAWFWRR
ncbi:MAG: DUF2905 domain-containing protein [Thermaerobacterales bacterium]